MSVVTSENNIIFGGPILQKITNNEKSLGEYFLNRFQALGDRVVLVDGVNHIEVTARELKENSINFAKSLVDIGIQDGDVIGICCENRFEFAYATFATVFLNAIVAPLNVTYTERELIHAMHLSKPKVIFASALTIKKILLVAEKESYIKHVICLDDTFESTFIIPYSKFLMNRKQIVKETLFKVKPTNTRETVVVIMCSSGTTGLPKGVQITQNNILQNADMTFGVKSFVMDATILSVLPWFHSIGFVLLMMYTTVGTKMVFLPKFHDKMFLECIQRYRVDACQMVPPLMVFLAKNPLVEKYDLSSLKALLCGGAPLKKETEDAIKNRLGPLWIRQGYGMSELTLGVLVQNDDFNMSGSVGTVRKGIYTKVVDIETGKALGPNQRGELCFKGELQMKGYVGDKTSTDQIIDSEGWLHTGDIGYYDEHFNFFIVDRIKELIKYKGFQVPPAEIEALLLSHPKIQDAAVVGLPDEVSGELPLAFVVRNDSNLSEKDVIDFVAESASPAKRLHGGVRFVNEIPKNASGKILRRVLKELVMNGVKSKL